MPGSCLRYGRTLWALVFNLLRQIDPTTHPRPAHFYPLTTEQTAALTELLAIFNRAPDHDAPDDYSDAQRAIDSNDDMQLEEDDENVISANVPTHSTTATPSSALDAAIQSVVLALFKHIHTGRTTRKFFSPVILFIVWSSFKLDGGMILANSITQRIAHLTYCGRGAIMNEIERILEEHPDWTFQQYVSPSLEY
jgi:hypothetical protein